VKPNGANICTAERGLEALEQLGAVDRPAGLRVREHEVVVTLPPRLLGQELQLSGHAARERDSPGGPFRLWSAELAADEVAPHAVAALEDVFGLELEERPAEENQRLWPQPVHAQIAGTH